jgi:hypothetical protein
MAHHIGRMAASLQRNGAGCTALDQLAVSGACSVLVFWLRLPLPSWRLMHNRPPARSAALDAVARRRGPCPLLRAPRISSGRVQALKAGESGTAMEVVEVCATDFLRHALDAACRAMCRALRN